MGKWKARGKIEVLFRKEEIGDRFETSVCVNFVFFFLHVSYSRERLAALNQVVLLMKHRFIISGWDGAG